MDTKNHATQYFFRAQTLAYWSFAGAVIPIAGIALAFISRRRLRSLTGADEIEQQHIDRTRALTTWGLVVSVVFLLAWSTAGFGVWHRASVTRHEQQQKEAALTHCMQVVRETFTNQRSLLDSAGLSYDKTSANQKEQQQLNGCPTIPQVPGFIPRGGSN